jgi:ribosome-binding ATPase YchF (GTP1/OBG family)
MAILEKCQAALNDTKPVRTIDFSKEERVELKQFFLITAKPAMFVANVSEDGFENNPFLDRLKEFAHAQNAPVVAIVPRSKPSCLRWKMRTAWNSSKSWAKTNPA